jgi:cellulose synthase/poly-beta-1,6-N-acetylglucosamine synthase-like glycosyltransferase
MKSRICGHRTNKIKPEGKFLNRENYQKNKYQVSFVIPMLNELEAIQGCIQSILDQTYPLKEIEILVVDGYSQDGSKEIVEDLCAKLPNIRLLDNPAKKTPVALNIGIRHARGEYVIILGAHTKIHRDFVRLNMKYIEDLNVKCVGGTQINIGETFIQKAIGVTMGSFMGMPSAPYRYRKRNGYVDTVVYAAYKKELFDEVGYFDEKWRIAEDAELNWRIRKAGYKIFFTPEIITYYYPRKTISGLFKQFFNYGILRINVIKKHLDAFKLIHIIPPLFVLVSGVLLLGGFFVPAFFTALLWLWAVYIVYLIIASLRCLEKKNKRLLLVLPIIFATLHLSWGLGFLVGIFIR